MPKVQSMVVTLVAAAAMTGCDGLVGTEADRVLVRTDRTEYQAEERMPGSSQASYSVSIIVRIENRGMKTVTLETCGAEGSAPVYGVEQLSGPEPRRSAFDPFWACPASEGVRLPAGATRVYTVNLSGPNAFDGASDDPYGSLAGRMRLQYFVQTCSGGAGCREPAASNSFRVSLD